MPVSVSARRTNYDGTRNVYCGRCREFIATVGSETMINSALCVICQAADRGETFTAEQIRELRSVRLANGQVLSLAAAYPDQLIDPMVDKEERVEGRLEYLVKVLVVNPIMQAVKALDEKRKNPPSKQLADSKRRPRVFSLPIDPKV